MLARAVTSRPLGARRCRAAVCGEISPVASSASTGAIRPSVAERISFEEVAEAHRRLEAGGLAAVAAGVRNEDAVHGLTRK